MKLENYTLGGIPSSFPNEVQEKPILFNLGEPTLEDHIKQVNSSLHLALNHKEDLDTNGINGLEDIEGSHIIFRLLRTLAEHHNSIGNDEVSNNKKSPILDIHKILEKAFDIKLRGEYLDENSEDTQRKIERDEEKVNLKTIETLEEIMSLELSLLSKNQSVETFNFILGKLSLFIS